MTGGICIWAIDGKAAAKAKGSASKRAREEVIFIFETNAIKALTAFPGSAWTKFACTSTTRTQANWPVSGLTQLVCRLPKLEQLSGFDELGLGLTLRVKDETCAYRCGGSSG